MSTESAEVFVGGIFRFNVGEEATAFVLHSKLVSRHSPVLHALMHGRMKEAEEKQTHLSNVDEDAFTRFAEFIYGGDYNVAEALIVLDVVESESHRSERGPQRLWATDVVEEDGPAEAAAESPHAEEAAADPPMDEWSFSRNSKKKRKRLQIPVRNRLSPFADFPLPLVDKVSFPKVRDAEADSDTELMYDYTEAICHVRLYVFAEQYQISDLKDLVMCKLHRALINTTFHPQRAEELVELIQLAYRYTPELKSKEEPLRNLLAHYVASNFEELAPMKEFQGLLIAGGAFVNDLCQKVCRRL